MTRTGEVVGTLAYMSPEQLRGEALTFGCDVWALAMIAYEMLTGRHAFAGEVLRHLPAARHGMPRQDFSALDAGAQRFFDRALAIRTTERPASAAGFMAAFEQALAE